MLNARLAHLAGSSETSDLRSLHQTCVFRPCYFLIVVDSYQTDRKDLNHEKVH